MEGEKKEGKGGKKAANHSYCNSGRGGGRGSPGLTSGQKKKEGEKKVPILFQKGKRADSSLSEERKRSLASPRQDVEKKKRGEKKGGVHCSCHLPARKKKKKDEGT